MSPVSNRMPGLRSNHNPGYRDRYLRTRSSKSGTLPLWVRPYIPLRSLSSRRHRARIRHHERISTRNNRYPALVPVPTLCNVRNTRLTKMLPQPQHIALHQLRSHNRYSLLRHKRVPSSNQTQRVRWARWSAHRSAHRSVHRSSSST